MAYFAPFIDGAGLHIPSYIDIRDALLSEMRSIFGDDIYLDVDSMDYQQISIFARKIFDTNSLAQLIYNNRTPITAIGIGLDNDVVYANIQRKPATFSTVFLAVTGTPGTVINKGEASDGSTYWVLPDVVTIPGTGIITVEARSKEPGEFGALPNTINTIATPTFGWLSVTNTLSAQPGTDVETDASLRGRFAMATQKTSTTVFEGLWAAIESIERVERVRGYENDTGVVSTGAVPPGVPSGLPPHSVTFVVEGGEAAQVATEIYNKKTPGCYTNGTTEVNIVSISGNVNVIRFYRPTPKNAHFKVTIKRLSGYNSEFVNKIKLNIVSYVSGLQIGENIYRSIVWGVATNAMESVNNPPFSVVEVETSTNGATWVKADITQLFYNTAVTTVGMVTVVET